MRIIRKDFKRITKIKIETLDDLWNLKHILDKDDIIGSRTLRTIDVDKRWKKPVFLKIKAEKINFSEDGKRLRVTGKIIEGPEDISYGYHTISIEINSVISVEKEWKKYQIRRLKDSLRFKGLKVLICVVDERRTDFAIATEIKFKEIGSVSNKYTGKLFGGESQEKYYEEIISFLNEQKTDKIIIAGPGFTKDSIFERLKKYPEILKKSIKENSSVIGKTGINEVIKRGALDRILEKSRISFETLLVERFLEELGKDSGLVTYGLNEIKNAVEIGAVDKLLISDKLVREEGMEKLMDLTEKNRGEVHIINSSHEAGERLFHLGGVAAFLRYKVE